MATAVRACVCGGRPNAFQDKLYGKGKRLFNEKKEGYRCTVSGTEERVMKAPPKKTEE